MLKSIRSHLCLSKNERRVVIVGEAGAGKSTALLRIAYECVRKSLEDLKSYKVPIIVRAVDVVDGTGAFLEEIMDESTRRLAGTQKACYTEDDLLDGRVILMVDAIDEVSDHASRAWLMDEVVRVQSKYPKMQVIVTARPYKFLQEMPEFAGFERFNISPISWKQAKKLISRVKAGRNLSDSHRDEMLRQIEQVHGIELSPLLVTVFAASSDETRRDIPANITELFKKYTELMLGRWDKEKGLNQQYQAPLKDFLLQRIAFGMHKDGVTSIEREEFGAQIDSLLRERGHRADLNTIVDEVLHRSGLFRVSGQRIEFRHMLIQEFFAGRAIATKEFAHEVIGDEWWRRAFVFYFGEHPTQAEVLRQLAVDDVESDVEPRWESANTIGLALQACYLSSVEKKLEVWQWVVGTLAACLEPVVDRLDEEAGYPLTAFVYYYLTCRDAVALSNLREHPIYAQRICGNGSDPEFEDAIRFWTISAYIEIGDMGEAKAQLERHPPKDDRMLLAIHMGAYLANKIRAIPNEERSAAEEICDMVKDDIQHRIRELMDEFGSRLLELRKGQVAKLEEMPEGSDRSTEESGRGQ